MGSYIEWMRSNSRISVTLCPAISVPVGFSRGGPAVGLQLVARPFGERALLEAAMRWSRSPASPRASRRSPR